MIDKTRMADLLILHEGVRRFPYVDTVGKLTIGVGFNLDDVGLYPEEIDFILHNRIDKMEQQLLHRLPEYRGLCVVRKMVMIDMAFNLGVAGLRSFRKMRAALDLRDYKLAATEMLDSKWATQVGGRATRLAQMMRSGEWPEDF